MGELSFLLNPGSLVVLGIKVLILKYSLGNSLTTIQIQSLQFLITNKVFNYLTMSVSHVINDLIKPDIDRPCHLAKYLVKDKQF